MFTASRGPKWVHVMVMSFCFLFPYILYYSNRNIITAAAPYLIDQGVLSQKTFATMQTCSYGMMIIAKFSVGLILTMLSSRMTHRALLFSCLLSIIGLALIATSLTSFTNGRGIMVTFIFCFAMIKFTSSILRPLLLSIAHLGFTGRGMEKERVSRYLGWISSILQCLACLGDVTGKLVFSTLVTSKQYIRWAAQSRIPVWSLSFITLGGMNILGAFLPIFTFTSPMLHNSISIVSCDKKGRLREMLPLLYGNLRFILLLFTNLLSGFCSVASGSYAVHFYRFALQFDSIYVTKFDSISPVCIALSILLVTTIIQRYMCTARKMLSVLIILALIDSILMRSLAFILTRDTFSIGDHSILIIFITHQTIFFGYAAMLDGLAASYLLPPVHLAPSVGIISAFSYLGGFCAPFIIYRWVSSITGWVLIFSILSWLQLAIMTTLVLISLIHANKSSGS